MTNKLGTKCEFIDDIKIKDVATTLDIHPFMLSRWRKEYQEAITRKQ